MLQIHVTAMKSSGLVDVELDPPLFNLQRLYVVHPEEMNDCGALLHGVLVTGPVTGVQRTLVQQSFS